MKKIIAVSLFAVGLAGCNATTTTVYTRPVPSSATVVYYPTSPAYIAYRNRYRNHCYTVWQQTPYGTRERKVCGYQ